MVPLTSTQEAHPWYKARRRVCQCLYPLFFNCLGPFLEESSSCWGGEIRRDSANWTCWPGWGLQTSPRKLYVLRHLVRLYFNFSFDLKILQHWSRYLVYKFSDNYDYCLNIEFLLYSTKKQSFTCNMWWKNDLPLIFGLYVFFPLVFDILPRKRYPGIRYMTYFSVVIPPNWKYDANVKPVFHCLGQGFSQITVN